jgi:hypothetical protein
VAADPPGKEDEKESGLPRDSAAPPLRSSAPPPPPPRPANYRIAFAAVWIAVQMLLIVTADRRADGAFGFRMFSESSTIKVALYREVLEPSGQRTRAHVDGGVWKAIGPDGVVRRLTWYDRVPSPFWEFDQEAHASYSAQTQLARLQAALDDVAAHMPNDAETLRFVLHVTVKRNGREAVAHELVSRERGVR